MKACEYEEEKKRVVKEIKELNIRLKETDIALKDKIKELKELWNNALHLEVEDNNYNNLRECKNCGCEYWNGYNGTEKNDLCFTCRDEE